MTALILLSEFKKTEIELWKPIENMPFHDVSNLGRLRSWATTVSVPTGDWRGARFQKVLLPSPVLLKPTPNRKWERISTLGGCYSVHRLVAKAFVPNPNNMPQVNHLNAIGRDNRAPNLEWTDHHGNHLHATVNGLRKRGEGIKHLARLKEPEIREIRVLRDAGIGPTEIAKTYGVNRSTIKRALNGRTWKHVA